MMFVNLSDVTEALRGLLEAVKKVTGFEDSHDVFMAAALLFIMTGTVLLVFLAALSSDGDPAYQPQEVRLVPYCDELRPIGFFAYQPDEDGWPEFGFRMTEEEYAVECRLSGR